MHISTFQFIIKIILNDKNLTMLTFFFSFKNKKLLYPLRNMGDQFVK